MVSFYVETTDNNGLTTRTQFGNDYQAAQKHYATFEGQTEAKLVRSTRTEINEVVAESTPVAA